MTGKKYDKKSPVFINYKSQNNQLCSHPHDDTEGHSHPHASTQPPLPLPTLSFEKLELNF